MGQKMKVAVYNSAGEQVMLLFDGFAQGIPIEIIASNEAFVLGSGSLGLDYGILLSNGNSALAWEGTNQSGQAVSGGVYTVKTQFVDSFGKLTEFSGQVQILAPPPAPSIGVYNAAGELVYFEQLSSYSGSVTGLDLESHVLVLEGDGMPGQKLGGTLHGNLGPLSWSWDGRNSQGNLVSQGVYKIHLISGQGGGVMVAKSVQVLAPQPVELSALKPVVAPHPVMGNWLGAGNGLSLRFIASSGTLQGRLFNLAGELVSSATAQASAGQMQFYPGALSSGIYLMALDYRHGSGARSRLQLKLIVLR
jgi:hypothetical protein